MAGIGNLAKVILTFVIFYCFKFSVFCHFGQFSSHVVIYFTHPVLEFYILKPLPYCVYSPVEPISCPFIQNSPSPIKSNVLLFNVEFKFKYTSK